MRCISYRLGIGVLVLLTLVVGCGGGSGADTGISNGGSGSGSSPPHLQLLSPSSLAVGVGASGAIPVSQVTLFGNNFTSDARVFVDGASSSTAIGSGILQVTGLNLTVGIHQFSVHEAAGNSNSLPFRIYTPQQGPQPFLAIPAYVTGPGTGSGVTTTDIDGDGLDDLIVTGPAMINGPSFGVLKGRPDGTLAPVTYVTGADASVMVSGDVNGDGRNDIIAISGSPSVTPVLNEGQGTFIRGMSVPLSGIFPGPAALAKMSGTSIPDLLVSVKEPNSILLLQNNGVGIFGSPKTIASTSVGNRNFLVADMNHDGLPDVIYTATDNAIHILVNQGSGSLADTLLPSLSDVNGYISVIDANKDGCPDLAIQSPTDSTAPVALRVFLNHCDATFSLASSVTIAPAGFAPYRLVSGDFDHDGFPDLAGVNGEREPSHILYLRGDGTGSFTPQQVNGPFGFDEVIGDVNGDGIPDVIVPGAVSLGRNDRNFPSPVSLTPFFAGAMSIGDINGDGLPDLLFAGDGFAIPGAVFINQGKGILVLSGVAPPFGFLLADMNGDGLADLIGVQGPNLMVWPGTGNPNFSSAPIAIPPPFSSDFGNVQVADVDGDGRLDLIAAPGGTPGGVIFFGLGNFQFATAQIPLSVPLAVGDFNGDGKTDLVGSNRTLLNQGNRQFKSISSNLNMIVRLLTIPVVADFNGDGLLDVAWVNGQSGASILIAYGLGDGAFASQGGLSPGDNIGGIAVADFNGDGHPDIVAGLVFTSQLTLYTNDGQAGFDYSYFATGASTNTMACGDLNQDGRPDVVIVNTAVGFRPPNAVVMLSK